MLDSHWDVKAKVTRAHAALGGGAGDLALGIFGSHLTHAWPRNMEDIVPAFMNTTETDTRYERTTQMSLVNGGKLPILAWVPCCTRLAMHIL